ncbi:MAG: hypothetical protein ACOCWC_04280 [Bacteroidota bacterium]
MKTKQKLFRFAFAFIGVMFILSMTFTACKKDPVGGTTDTNNVSTVFTVPDATLKSGAIPDGGDSGPSITNLSGNSHVLPGGSNSISVETNDAASTVLVGIVGMAGYYELPVTTDKNNELLILVYLFIEQNLEMEEFTIVFALMEGSEIGYHMELPVTIVEAGTGKLQASLSWDKEVDLDLYLVEPNGTTIYYGNNYSENGGNLDVDSNAGCSIDGIKNENITYGDEAIVEAGEYIVRVNLWSECGISDQINYIATANLDGNAINPSWGANPKYGNYPAGSVGDGGDVDAGVEVMKFNVSASKLTDVDNYYKFSFPVDKSKVYTGSKF